MAAATQVPAGPWANVNFSAELINNLNTAVAIGIFATSDTVSTALTNLATEKGDR